MQTNVRDIIKANISATVIEYHIPFVSNIKGRTTTEDSWNKSVLKNEITADTAPLFNAVKSPDANIFKPASKNENANIRNALTVRALSSASYPTNICAKGFAKIIAINVRATPALPITITLFLNMFLSSSELSDPKLYPITGATPIIYPMYRDININ